MKRLYEPAAYARQTGCWWAETTPALNWGGLSGGITTDVAVIGGGFTGLSAALHLADAGVQVTVLEAETPGYGASGRNGGFCCLGGAKAPSALLRRRFGQAGLADWRQTERAAINLVSDLLRHYKIDADTHSTGETTLAHTARAMATLRRDAPELAKDYNTSPVIVEKADLRGNGFGGSFHGALTLPIGFALNPRKYHSGLAAAAQNAGATLHAHSPVTALKSVNGATILTTPHGQVTAKRVIIATNGYSSDDVPDWLRGRTLPVQSSILITRPLTPTEQQAQGWTTDQMAYDTRTLLHYFRKLPDGRFLFGMRGGLRATPHADAAIRRRIRADFNAMFPAWRDVKITHDWSGLVCLMANLTPYAGPVPGMPGVFAGMGYHGNGVAMASLTGRILAALAQGKQPPDPYPAVLRAPPKRFPLGRYRRLLLAPAYAAASLLDR